MPSRPPPPEPYETWLDWVVGYYSKDYAAAELAELRDKYDKQCAMTAQMQQEIAELRTKNKSVTVPPTQVITMPLSVATYVSPDPADEYMRTVRAAIEAAKGTK